LTEPDSAVALLLQQNGDGLMKIYGDNNSGNCLKVKWVCDKLALPYSWIAVDTLKSETRTTEFLKLNYAGQVPAVEFEDGRTIKVDEGDSLYIPGGVCHNETRASDELEILEISVPAAMGTKPCDPPEGWSNAR